MIRSAPPLLNRSGVVRRPVLPHGPLSTGSSPTTLGKEEARWPYDESTRRRGAPSSYDAVVRRRSTRSATVNDAGIRASDVGPSLGRRRLPRRGLECPAHGRRRPRLPVLPRERDRPALHPRTGGRARHLPAGRSSRTTSPRSCSAALHRAGVDIRPEAMGVDWDDARDGDAASWHRMSVSRTIGLHVADVRPVTDELLDRARERRSRDVRNMGGLMAPDPQDAGPLERRST